MTMTSATALVEKLVRQSITAHYAPRVSMAGKDITHHEPVTHVTVQMSPRFTEVFLRSESKPQSVDGVPIVYAEKPAPGSWSVMTMCHYTRTNGRPSRSRGRLVRGQIDRLTP